jgi:hypothetical protein
MEMVEIHISGNCLRYVWKWERYSSIEMVEVPKHMVEAPMAIVEVSMEIIEVSMKMIELESVYATGSDQTLTNIMRSFKKGKMLSLYTVTKKTVSGRLLPSEHRPERRG